MIVGEPLRRHSIRRRRFISRNVTCKKRRIPSLGLLNFAGLITYRLSMIASRNV
uniref:Uncharacterized protein n=1 Tax=Parascaris equorum TaxID=6256 RepID=A0A914RRM5_PAREQ